MELISQMLRCLFTFVFALILSLYLTPVMRRAALQFGIVDRPDGKLKKHKKPIAYLGGVSIYLSFLLALAFTFKFDQEVLGLLLAGTIVLLLGLIDDLGFLKPWVKFSGQLIAVLVLVKSGIFIKLVFLPIYISIPLTFLWLVGMINAFNIIDVMDGLAAGVAFFAASAFFVVALLNGRMMIAIVAITLAGSLLGFLRYNFTPARIYMGDTGSMFLGLMLGAMATIGSYTEKDVLGFLAPVVILGIPIFDTCQVIVARWRKGMPFYQGSPDHYALLLRSAGLSVKGVTWLSYAAAAILGVLGILMMNLSSLSQVLIVAGLLALTGIISIVLLQRIKVR
ncbi:MAG: undecaprenyl/decaprenyl-phosphate alpha-N-acetylglucosaminyl 1-phosphate transferase [Deltaproteobacteria bacterium]|nr:undecaprenyl/decaprenyl-phosphate alpha-N-acetylglucosaminyl 1-phosphate transferase [Deltaproteobacteria bacterium]